MRANDFDGLFAEHAGRLFSFLIYRTGDRALAEDVLADTFERALRSRRRFDPRKASQKTWLYAIALNRLRDHRRRIDAHERALERAGSSSESSGADAMTRIETRHELSQALAILSDDERQAIALRYGAELTLPEIAALTGESLTTMEGRVYRALKKLRDALARDS
jgi:RNA polymerase sigma factor (sigma-70 family)